MTTQERLIAARTEINFGISYGDSLTRFINAYIKHPYINRDNEFIKPDIRSIVLKDTERLNGIQKMNTPEEFVFKKLISNIDEEINNESPEPKYSKGMFIQSKEAKGEIHKVSRNHWGYVYCVWNQRPDGTIIGNACINESDIGNDNPNLKK